MSQYEKNSTWEQLQLLALRSAPPAPAVIEAMLVAPLRAYVPYLFDQLEDYLEKRSIDSSQCWRNYTGVRREHDVETLLLPELLQTLTKFAVEGDLQQGYQAVSSLLEALAREMLRQGVIPVLIATKTLNITTKLQALTEEDLGTPDESGEAKLGQDVKFGEDTYTPTRLQ
jgi:hypothetical protein